MDPELPRCCGHLSEVGSGVPPPITINSRWIRKQVPIEVEVTRVTFRKVSYIAIDKSFSGTLPHWQFLVDFKPVTGRQKPR